MTKGVRDNFANFRKYVHIFKTTILMYKINFEVWASVYPNI